MKNKAFLLFGTLGMAILAGISALFWRDSARKLESQTQSLAQVRAETAELRKQNKKVSEEIEQTLSATARVASSQEASPAVQEQEDPFLKKTDALAGRAALLQEKMKQTPGAMIPELGLLRASEWFELGEDAYDLSTPEKAQEVFANVRRAARQTLFNQLRIGIFRWEMANPQGTLVDVQQLKPYIPDEAITPEMLSRYEIVPPQRWNEFTSNERPSFSRISRTPSQDPPPGAEPESSPWKLVIEERTPVPGALEGRARFVQRADSCEIWWAAVPRELAR